MLKNCADCKTLFQTEVTGRNSPVRCEVCRLSFRLANHGGGPRRRCKKYDVPYESINPRVVFERDGWICRLCFKPLDQSLLGEPLNPMAPEMDHEWPLSVRINGLKSPGHVLSNIGASHRACNGEKGDRISEQQARVLTGKFYPEIRVVCFAPLKVNKNPERRLTCTVCSGVYIGRSLKRKTCSSICRKAHEAAKEKALKRNKGLNQIPEKGVCLHCGADFKPRAFNQKYCSELHAKYAYKKRQSTERASQHSCLSCKNSFTPLANQRKYCSKRCRRLEKKRRHRFRKGMKPRNRTIQKAQ